MDFCLTFLHILELYNPLYMAENKWVTGVKYHPNKSSYSPTYNW